MVRRSTAAALMAGVLVLALSAPNALAAKGGNGHGRTTVACSVSPSTVAVGETFTVQADGLPADGLFSLDEQYPGFFRLFAVGSDASGHLSFTDTAVAGGSVSILILDVTRRKPVLVSTCSFTVV